MLEARGLTKRYGALLALDRVDFQVRRGEILGYLGPNGSGKSTTVNVVVGLIEPSAGSLWLDGLRMSDDPVAYKRRIGYVPEEPHLYTHLTATEYLMLVGRLRGLPERTLTKKVPALLQRLLLPLGLLNATVELLLLLLQTALLTLDVGAALFNLLLGFGADLERFVACFQEQLAPLGLGFLDGALGLSRPGLGVDLDPTGGELTTDDEGDRSQHEPRDDGDHELGGHTNTLLTKDEEWILAEHSSPPTLFHGNRGPGGRPDPRRRYYR